jgi:ribosomal protein S18 acetylase RimI-like enzyme
MNVRAMDEADVPRVATLLGELGYPTRDDELLTRFASVRELPDEALFVFEIAGIVQAWMQVRVMRPLEVGVHAEISGLVVSASARRTGAGRALVTEAERWARSRNLSNVTVRSNVTRDASHAFYKSLGFRAIKTQHVYVLSLC